MFNFVLYCREMKGLWKMLAIFVSVMTMYIAIVVSMYDPKLKDSINQLVAMMPGLMDAMGFNAENTGLIGYFSSYLYGFILVVFPMVFSILCGNKLIARYVDKGSMVSLLSAPVKRRTVAFTQMKVITTGIVALVVFATIIIIALSEICFPGELDIPKFLLINIGLLCLHLFIGGICFIFSCIFSDAKYSIGLGAGIPSLMFILQMLGNVGGSAETAKYFTFFTLFNPDGLSIGESSSIAGTLVLFAGAIMLFFVAITVFSKKDLHI